MIRNDLVPKIVVVTILATMIILSTISVIFDTESVLAQQHNKEQVNNITFPLTLRTRVRSESQVLSQAENISAGIPVQTQPVGIGVNSITSKIYVSNSLSNTVSVIDGLTNRVINSIDVGSFPTSLSVNSYFNRIYVLNGIPSRSISVIDGFTDKIKAEIKIGSVSRQQQPNIVYVDPNNSPRYYTITNDTLLEFMDPNVKNISSDSIIEDNHYGMAIGNDFSKYITNYNNNSVSVLSYNGSVFNLKVGESPRDIVFNPETNKVYVGNERSNIISVIDDTTYKVNNITLPSSRGVWNIALNPKTNTVYATDRSVVYVIDGFTNTMKAQPISTGFGTNQIAVDSNKNMIYVTNTNLNSVFAINGERNKVVVAVNFKINPQNAGEVFCRSASNPYLKISSNYPMFDVGTQYECEARSNPGFGFSSWSSSNTTSNATNPLKFKASHYGKSFAANFAVALSVDKYLGILIAYFAILGPIIAVSSITGWVVNIKRRNNFAKYTKVIDDIFDNASSLNKKDTLKLLQGMNDHITEITIKGQNTSFRKLFKMLGYRPITQSDYQLLINKIMEYKEKVNKMY